MAASESQKPECSKDNISTNSIDEGLPRELSQLSLSSATSQDELFSDKGHSDSTLKNIFGYFQAQKLCDVALIAGGCSEYFAAMFTGSLREAQLTEITLERVDPQALQLAKRRNCRSLTINCKPLTVKFGNKRMLCVPHEAARPMQLFGHSSLCRAAVVYGFAQGCPEIHLPVFHEEPHDVGAERQHQQGTTPALTAQYLIDKVEHACGNVLECQPLIMEAVKWHLLPERRSLLFSHRTRPRTSTIGRLLAIGGMDGYKGASNMEMYDPRTNSWTPFMRMGARRLQFGVAVLHNKLVVVECFDLQSLTWNTLAPMNTHRHGLGVAVLGDSPNSPVYAVGGHDGWIYLNSVERGARSTCGVAALRGRLYAYAAGGRDGGACLRSVECYDPATNHWTNCAPMTRRRGGLSVCAAGGYLYALGGHEAPANSTAGRLACVERYDPAADSIRLRVQLLAEAGAAEHRARGRRRRVRAAAQEPALIHLARPHHLCHQYASLLRPQHTSAAV
ncbi:Kelch-like protein 5 [Operophtera brumata]|uniref:Kelch-like protein 5 n=1 Tax=Operophtera brumata TaxID=104452 RepID=A0A0L7LKX2_OPEBR|nr:Kelch-like protein 5 [Operophtera brumata]